MKNPFPVVSPGQMLETLYHKSKNLDWQWSSETRTHRVCSSLSCVANPFTNLSASRESCNTGLPAAVSSTQLYGMWTCLLYLYRLQCRGE